MGRRVVEILFDDVTGDEAEEVVEHVIAVDGKTRYIDMTPATFERFMEAITPFFEKGRKNGMPTPRSQAQVPRHSPEEREGLRAWAAKHGVVYTKGRAPSIVWDAYYADNPGQLPAEKFKANAERPAA